MKRLLSLTNGSAGFTLIEILISVVVLAIGLLGMAALQMNGLRNNQSAYFRAQATQLAYDMADRMRTNIVEARDATSGGTYNNGASTANNCATGPCTTAQTTGYDFSQWSAELTVQLPSGAGRVCIDGTPNDGTSAVPACDGAGTVYAIKVWWDDNRSGAANQRFVMSFQPWN
ncbi:MAG: type IV pilus modification protein PilV [Gammaproteobacteria bacterium]